MIGQSGVPVTFDQIVVGVLLYRFKCIFFLSCVLYLHIDNSLIMTLFGVEVFLPLPYFV
jgi:hypothetical protein